MTESGQQENTREHADYDYELQGPDLLDLWKFEEDQGNTVKGRMLTIVTWLLALATGVLGFTVKELGILSGKSDMAEIAIGLSVLGLGICGYAWFLVREFGNHMRRHWESADFLRARIKGLDEIKRRGGPEFPSLEPMQLPQICQQVLVIVIFFAVIFVAVLSYCVYTLLNR
jgi:hypothetical protein